MLFWNILGVFFSSMTQKFLSGSQLLPSYRFVGRDRVAPPLGGCCDDLSCRLADALDQCCGTQTRVRDAEWVKGRSWGELSSHMCHGLNPHYFHIIGDKLINPIVGVYIPIIRIPYFKGWMSLSPIQGV